MCRSRTHPRKKQERVPVHLSEVERERRVSAVVIGESSRFFCGGGALRFSTLPKVLSIKGDIFLERDMPVT